MNQDRNDVNFRLLEEDELTEAERQALQQGEPLVSRVSGKRAKSSGASEDRPTKAGKRR